MHTQQYYHQNNKLQNINIQNLLFPKRSWTREQDELLAKLVENHGPNRWSHIAKMVPHRKGKQCRERWFNHLDPQIKKQEWSLQQQWILFLGHLVLNSKWSKLTKLLPGRTDNNIKNHWNSIMKKKLPKYQQMFNKESLNISTCQNATNKQMSLALLQKYGKNNIPQLYQQIQTKSNIHSEANICSPNLEDKQLLSDDLSFSNILKKIDQNQNLNRLQNQVSYKYNDSAKGKKKQDPSQLRKAKQQQNISDGEKINLKPIQNLFQQEDEQIVLPIPLRRLSTLDYETVPAIVDQQQNI